jgi:hypothetical protein
MDPGSVANTIGHRAHPQPSHSQGGERNDDYGWR